MRIDITELGPEGLHVTETFEASDLAGGTSAVRDALWEPVRVDLATWARRERRHVRASGTYRMEARAECDRCLKPVTVSVAGEFDVRYRTSTAGYAHAGRDERELRDEDLGVDELDGTVLDTRDLAREQAELAVPIQTLCSEQCAGLCAVCGADRNLSPCSCADAGLDPRWDALRKLRLNDEG